MGSYSPGVPYKEGVLADDHVLLYFIFSPALCLMGMGVSGAEQKPWVFLHVTVMFPPTLL